jgi:6-phospho-beta-glucosidase
MEVAMSVITFAVLGGSSVGTPALIDALLHWPGQRDERPELRVVLLGRSLHKLQSVQAACERMIQDAYPPIHLEATTDWHTGLSGADYVLNQMRVGGLEARAHDETFPQSLGIPGEETIGPGGFANALRTIPVVLDALHLVSQVAPEALVLNLTNPAGMVQHATLRATKVRMISLCDSPTALRKDLLALLDIPPEQAEIGYLGMNHLGWVVSLRHAGQDLLDNALKRVESLASFGEDAPYIRASRAIPLPYVRFYLHPDRILTQQQGKFPRSRQLQALEQTLLEDYEHAARQHNDAVSSSFAKRGAVWYSAIVVPVLDALINNRHSTWIVNVPNSALIPWLPPETVIEVPASIDRQGVHPLPVEAGLLSGELRALLYAQATYEALAVPAIIERNRMKALQALIAHPLVRSLDRAERVLDAIWPAGGMNDE